MQKQKIILIVGILILTAAGSLYLVAKNKSAQITDYEECIKAGWLVRSIRIYDGFGPIEAECVLWSGKSFEKKRLNDDPLRQSDSEASQRTNAEQKIASKIDDQEGVKIIVAPVDFSAQLKEWEFGVVVSTHSVELDQDMAKIAVLIDDQGKEYRSLRWEGGPVGGHHIKGSLIFDPIQPLPEYVELKIKDIGGVAERLFKWEIK